MLLIFAANAYKPERVFDFYLENGAVTILLTGLIWSYRKLSLSDLSYVLIVVYLSLHEWGAHYKYSDVPLGEWMKPLLHTSRNMYDRVAHFSFGLMLSYPMQEVFMRSVGVTSRWRYMLPIEATLSFINVTPFCRALLPSSTRPFKGLPARVQSQTNGGRNCVEAVAMSFYLQCAVACGV